MAPSSEEPVSLRTWIAVLAAAEKYEPIKGHFPGGDFPLAVIQIDHTPMDVIVVVEEHPFENHNRLRFFIRK
jgi:putative transposase